MTRIPIPKPSFLDRCKYYKTINGKKTWRSPDNRRFYQWDEYHGEVEVYNKKGLHLGALDARTGEVIKEAVRGRKIDLS